MEDKDYSYQQEHIVQNVLSPSPLDKEPSLLGGGPNTDVRSSLIRVITQESGKDVAQPDQKVLDWPPIQLVAQATQRYNTYHYAYTPPATVNKMQGQV